MKFKLAHKLTFDSNSIRFKLWLYFALFATFLMIILWTLQIFFLNNYYQEMKIAETNRIANVITSQYNDDGIVDIIRNLSYSNDMYIHLETTDGTIIFSPASEGGRRPSYGYINEMGAMKDHLLASGKLSISTLIPEGRTDMNTLAYAGFIQAADGSSVILYIFSPLYPVDSTIAILKQQLIYITVIALAAAFALSAYMSTRITKPIKKITNQAAKLAKGDYGVTFDGGIYTEITNLADTLTQASVELGKSDQLQKDLIANVSHDIRTPLTMVKSYAEMIRDISGDNAAKRKHHLQVIIDEADRLNQLVGDMLTLSKMQSGVDVLSKTEFNMAEVIDSVVHPYADIMKTEGYKIITDCDESLWVIADLPRIKQVVSNLLNNAIKYCGKDKTVLINLKSVGDKVRCEVIDHGMGVGPDEISQIWERYQKGSTNHVRKTSGTGLGLSIVKEILVLHDADFGVESTPGEGSNFWFELRLA